MNFKRIILMLFLLVVLGFIASAQKITKNYFADLHKKTIELKNSKEPKPSLPFSNIIIRDARQDTSCLAFFTAEVTYKVDLENGVVPSITNYIKSSYSFSPDSDSSVNLFMVIKKLWLTDLIAVADEVNPTQTKWNPGIIFEAEFFSEKNGLYHTLYKTDTIIATTVSLKGNEDFYIQKAVTTSFEKFSNKQLPDIRFGKKEFTQQNIDNYISGLHSYPITKDSVLKKGVYKTFEEFKNNAPAVTEFEIKKDAMIDVLYATENKQSYLLRDFWGYCDGANIYINSADNFFQLFKCQNTFNVRGFKYIKKRKQVRVENILMFGLAGGVVGKGNKRVVYKGTITSMQLDMGTGELF